MDYNEMMARLRGTQTERQDTDKRSGSGSMSYEGMMQQLRGMDKQAPGSAPASGVYSSWEDRQTAKRLRAGGAQGTYASFGNWLRGQSSAQPPQERDAYLKWLDEQIAEAERYKTHFGTFGGVYDELYGGSAGRDAADTAGKALDSLRRARTVAGSDLPAEYAELTAADDFESKSRYSTTRQSDTKNRILGREYSQAHYGDLLYDYINHDRTAMELMEARDAQEGRTQQGLDHKYLLRMNGEEINTYNYLYATQGKEAADKFVESITDRLTARQRGEEERYWTQYAKENPVKASIFSTLAAPAKGLSYIGQIADYAGDGQIDQNAGYNKFSYIPGAIRGERDRQIRAGESGFWSGADTALRWLGQSYALNYDRSGETLRNMRTWEQLSEKTAEEGAEIGSFLYQTGMSNLDFLWNTAVTGGTQAVSLALMGTGAAADAVVRAKDEGMDDRRAFILGTIAGAAEVVTEKVSIETLLNPALLADGGLKYVIKNMLAEGGEEVGSDLINWLAEFLYDAIAREDQSTIRKTYQRYLNEGMSEGRATWKTIVELATDAGMDFLGGALSGGLMAGAGAAGYSFNASRLGASLQQQGGEAVTRMLRQGQDFAEGSRANTLSGELLSRLEAGQELGANELGRAVMAIAEEQQTRAEALEMLSDAADEIAAGKKIGDKALDAILENREARAALEMADPQRRSGRKPQGAMDFFAVDQSQDYRRVQARAALETFAQRRQELRQILDEAQQQTVAAQKAVGAQLAAYGPEGVKEFVKNALELGGESRVLAEALLSKLDAGQTLTDEELGKLVLTAEAEREASGETASGHETTPHQSPAATASPQGEARRAGNDGAYGANEKAASGTETAEGSTESRAADARRPGTIERETIGNGEGIGQTIGNLTEEGTGYGAETGAGAGYISDRGGRRDAGERAGGQARQLGRGAEEARAAAEQSAAAARRKHQAQSLRLERTSPLSLGIQNGSTLPGVTVMPEAAWDEEMRAVAQKVYNETGKQVVFVLGTIEVTGRDGKAHKVRGVNTALGQIILQADHLGLSVTQLGDHELFHDYLRHNPGLAAEVKRKILDSCDEAEFNSVVQKYIRNYAGVYDADEDMDAQTAEQAADRILAEIYCDAFAGVNAFGAEAGRWQAEAVAAAEERGAMGRGAEYAAATERTNGPGEDVYSIGEIVGTNEDYGVGVILDTNIFDGVSPRNWGKVLGNFVYNNLAGTQLTMFDENGNPETVDIARLNDRVKKDGAKNSHKVIDKLARYRGDNIKALATVHLSELLSVSGNETSTDEHTHQWMDENGWIYRTVYIQDRSGKIYEATLNIAEGKDRRILYDISNIRRIDRSATGGVVPSTANGGARSTSHSASESYYSNNSEKVNTDDYSIDAEEQAEASRPLGELPGRELMREAPDKAWSGVRARAGGEEGQAYGREREAAKEQAKADRKTKNDENNAAWLRQEIERRSGKDVLDGIYNEQGARALANFVAETTRLQQRLDRLEGKVPQSVARKAEAQTPKAKPNIARQELRNAIMADFSIPAGERERTGRIIDRAMDLLLQGGLTEQSRRKFFDILYSTGVMHVAADDYHQEIRRSVIGNRVYVPESLRADFGDDWNDFRRRAWGAGLVLTSDRNALGVDSLNGELANLYPGAFHADETDMRTALETMVQMAEEGKGEDMSLEEYTRMLAGMDYITEDEVYDNLERQLDWRLRTFAEKAALEVRLKDRSAAQQARERARRREMTARQAEQRELRELQDRTMRQLQWAKKNARRMPPDFQARIEEIIGSIDTVAKSAIDLTRWSGKYNATVGDVIQAYRDARNPDSERYDPNLLENKEIESWIRRAEAVPLDTKDPAQLQTLLTALLAVRNEFYNRNNFIDSEVRQIISETATDAAEELREGANARKGKVGELLGKVFTDLQLTPMNRFLSMVGWNKGSAWYSMAQMLEEGARAQRRFTVRANAMLADFLRENADWCARSDGQGKDGIWYEVEIPSGFEYEHGDEILGNIVDNKDTVKVWMTAAQKVHLWLESQNEDNLRHMTGGRTFVDKELYSKGKRSDAFAKGTTVRLSPETVRRLVADMTPEEMAMARALQRFYNEFSRAEINRVSNALYGYDKAMGGFYAPIYTNSNYTQSEPGVFDVTAEGVGNLKERQHAANPSYNISAMDAFEKAVQRTAKFVGLAIPIRNVNMLIHQRVGEQSFKDVLTHAQGGNALKFVENLLTELQGGKEINRSGLDEFANKALSKYISSVFGLNPSIVLKQAASFPLAAAYLGAGNMPNIAKALRVSDGLINTYTSELAYRLLGYSTPETAALKDNPGRLQKKGVLNFVFGGGAITWMDGVTVKTLWSWAENKVRAEHPELQIGTQEQIEGGTSEFYKAVAKEFEEATSRSQPMYDVMHRSEVMRSDNGLMRAFTLFKTVPQQEFNMLREAIGEAMRAKRSGNEENVRQANRQVGRAVLAIAAGNLMIGVITFLNALWKGRAKRYKDDDGELTAQSVLSQFAIQFLKDGAGVTIFGDTVADVLGAWITGDKFYGIDAPGIAQINSILTGIVDTGKKVGALVQGSVEVAQNGGDWGQYMRENGSVLLKAVDELATMAATYIPGFPADNLKAYLLGPVSWISPELEVAYEDAMNGAKKAGLSGLGGAALEMRVQDILKDRTGAADEVAVQTLAGLYSEGFKGAIPAEVPKSVSMDGKKIELNLAQQQTYKNVWSGVVGAALDELVQSEAFSGADAATQEKMLKALYNVASDTAKSAIFEDYEPQSKKAAEAVEKGLRPETWAEWSGMTSDMKDAEKYAALREQPWDDGTKAILAESVMGEDAFTRFTEAGLDAETAYKAIEAIKALEPLPGRTGVSDAQKWAAAVGALPRPVDQEKAMRAVMTDQQEAKFDIAKDAGVSAESYARLYAALQDFDEDGNGKANSEEVKATIDKLTGLASGRPYLPGADVLPLNDEQRGVMWQLMTDSTSAKNNPYSRSAGEKVLDEKKGS